jgi:SPP1 family phage portal protein
MIKSEIMRAIIDSADVQGLSAIFKDLILQDITSPDKKDMIDGVKYYDCKHDINLKQRYYYDANQQKRIDATKSNFRIVNPFHADFVDQKIDYLLGKKLTLSADNDEAQEYLDNINNNDLHLFLRTLGTNISNKGKEYVYFFVNDSGALDWAIFDAATIVVIRDTGLQEKPIAYIRYYSLTQKTGDGEKDFWQVEYYDKKGVHRYKQNVNTGLFEPDEALPFEPYISIVDATGRERSYRWIDENGEPYIPIIELKNNETGASDLKRIKRLVDAYDRIESGFFDNIEDVQEVLKVIKGAGGADIAELVENLKYYKAVAVDDSGGIESVEINIPTEARTIALERLYKDIHFFGQAVLIDPEKIASGISGVALKFLYSRLDMKASRLAVAIETFCPPLPRFNPVNWLMIPEVNSADFSAVR